MFKDQLCLFNDCSMNLFRVPFMFRKFYRLLFSSFIMFYAPKCFGFSSSSDINLNIFETQSSIQKYPPSPPLISAKYENKQTLKGTLSKYKPRRYFRDFTVLNLRILTYMILVYLKQFWCIYRDIFILISILPSQVDWSW